MIKNACLDDIRGSHIQNVTFTLWHIFLIMSTLHISDNFIKVLIFYVNYDKILLLYFFMFIRNFDEHKNRLYL